MTGETIYNTERLLDDDYPIYAGYFYLVNGKVYMADFSCTAGELKKELNTEEIRNCDLAERNMLDLI